MWQAVIMIGFLITAIYSAYLLVDRAVILKAPEKTEFSVETSLKPSNNQEETQTKSELLNRLSEIKFQDYQGKDVSVNLFEGKPLILNSWASWCPFCVQELPAFSQVQAEFKDKVVIAAINRKESLSIARNFSDRVGVAPENLYLWLDPNDSFYRTIGGFSMPETLFIDKEGNIAEHKRGPMEFQEIREKTAKLIE